LVENLEPPNIGFLPMWNNYQKFFQTFAKCQPKDIHAKLKNVKFPTTSNPREILCKCPSPPHKCHFSFLKKLVTILDVECKMIGKYLAKT